MKCFFFSKAICLSLGAGVLFLLFAQRDTLFGVDDTEGTLFGGYICNLHKVGGEVHKDEGIIVGCADASKYGVGDRNAVVQEFVVEVYGTAVSAKCGREPEMVSVGSFSLYTLVGAEPE